MFSQMGEMETNLFGLIGILVLFMGQIGKSGVFRMHLTQWRGPRDDTLIKSFESTMDKDAREGLTTLLLLSAL